jgi:predicted nucleic acid-binding protein
MVSRPKKQSEGYEMLNDLPLKYWDACVPLSYINGDPDRLPHIEALLQLSGKEFQIITSVISVTEVAFAKMEQDNKALDAEKEVAIQKLWNPGSPIQIVEFFELLANKAKELMRKGLEQGWKLKAPDAIHLATADHLHVSEFNTYDDKLAKFSLLTETKFNIVPPIASQPVMILSSSAPE